MYINNKMFFRHSNQELISKKFRKAEICVELLLNMTLFLHDILANRGTMQITQVAWN